jgi:hypothetical protein
MDLKTYLSACERLVHREHQLVGVEQLVKMTDPGRIAVHNGVTYRREIPGVFALFDEVGAGKTKQIIDTAQVLYYGGPGFKPGQIDTVLTLTPGFARSTWADSDPLLGEVAKHAWTFVPNIVHEFHGNYTDLDFSEEGLHWVVTNYEFIRRDERRDQLLLALKGRRVWMIVDESWCVKGNSDQTRACIMIRRKRADRVTILNGTPLSDGKPMDLYYQFMLLDSGIIGAKTKAHFKSKYFIMGGFNGQRVVDYQNLDELNARIAPYVLSRRTRDCFDLPPMLPPVTVEARLSDSTWKIYRSQRDDMVSWLGAQVSVSKQAIVKILRLSQITSGFLGGLEDVDDEGGELPLLQRMSQDPMPAWLRKATNQPDEQPTLSAFGGPFDAAPVKTDVRIVCKEISREKLDAFMNWLETMQVLPNKLVAWCRFRPELERATKELQGTYKTVLNLRGGQTPDDRRIVKKMLAPGGDPSPTAVVGITGTGAASLNFSAANIMVFMSHDPALIKRTQSIGRIERPGQTQPMLLVDVIATGPKGQKTIDHHLIKSLRAKDDMARWTVNQWRSILQDE